MAVLAILDLLRKNPNFGGQTFNSRGLFSKSLAGASSSAAAASSSFVIGTPFAFGTLFGNGETRYAYCDAGTALVEDYISSSIRTSSGNIFRNDALTYNTKQYNIQLKPLLSAFHWKNLALTSLRSFLLFYLPLLEPHYSRMEEDDDDFLWENTEENRIDLVVPFKKSVKQIMRETTVVTTRRILERLAVHYVSQRVAWKLIKDAPTSATRKASRGLATSTYIFCVSRTTLRGHFLGVLASWVVQVGVDIFHFFTNISKARRDRDTVDTAEQVRFLGKKVYGATIRCGASLVFASVGAGIGAALVRPSAGQWIGCAVGDLAGPVIVSFCFGKLHVGF